MHIYCYCGYFLLCSDELVRIESKLQKRVDNAQDEWTRLLKQCNEEHMAEVSIVSGLDARCNELNLLVGSLAVRIEELEAMCTSLGA